MIHHETIDGGAKPQDNLPASVRPIPREARQRGAPLDVWRNDFSVVVSPLLGEDFQFDEYFSDGLKPPPRFPFLVF